MTTNSPADDPRKIVGIETTHPTTKPLPNFAGMQAAGQANHLAGLTFPGTQQFAEKFTALGGHITEGGIFVLDYGTGVKPHPTQASPLLVPAPYNGAPLSKLSIDRVDLESLQTALTFQLAPNPQELLPKMSVYAFLVPRADALGYVRYDLRDPRVSGQRAAIDINGEISYGYQGKEMIGFKDGVYVHALYHPDRNRIATEEGWIAVCGIGQPNKIKFLEMESLLLPTAASTDGWLKAVNFGDSFMRVGDEPGRFGPAETGAIQMGNQNFLWIYRFDRDAQGRMFFSTSCYSRGPDGGPVMAAGEKFFALRQFGCRPVIDSEPGITSSVISIGNLVSGGRAALDASASGYGISRATGLILYEIQDGTLKITRTSLTKLITKNTTVGFEGNDVVLYEIDSNDGSMVGEKARYRTFELRSKFGEGWKKDSCDVYAMSTKDLSPELNQMAPFVGAIGDRQIIF